MATSSRSPIHPGTYVRAHILPDGITVADAAKRLGIGRPALSNFLNGKSSLSANMAIRLEKAFDANRKQLMDMQAAYDRKGRGTSGQEIAVRAFVPAFLVIKAQQIDHWADQIDSRSRLPVLLRKLVHSTGDALRQVDFPGYDNAQRKGPDGFVNAGAATPWVPEGKSYWEFGTDKDPGRKAEKDYLARMKSVGAAERAVSTFVFVTPRDWPGKEVWQERKNDAGDWKAVRAMNGSDLEQWLEQSVPAQIWFAERLDLPIRGYETLEKAWDRWANVSEPHLTRELFASSIAASRDRFRAWIEKTSDRAFIVAADSRDEALSFLACLFDEEGLDAFKDRAAIFTSPGALRALISSSVPFIPIVHSQDVERELAGAHRRLHCIVCRPRNAVDARPDIALDLLNYEAFKSAVTAMGIEDGEVDRLARESGRSPTILRRRLARNAAIRTPAWATDDDTAKDIIPMGLVGAWFAESKADREILSYVAGRLYEAIEDEVAHWVCFDDAPLWSAGHYRGVASKIDALFAIARMVTSADLDRFFFAAEVVLSESNPALDLPANDRWAAALYGKTRDHSAALREGICETLVLLSIHGNHLFQNRLGIDVESRVAVLIRKLLTPLTLAKLLSHDDELPHYAEAAPSQFLEIVETDLQRHDPVIFGLLKPVDASSFGASPSRTGLLWALECLAWKPQNLTRVALILAMLSGKKIDDNWGNKPDASLQAIFRSWMPQTAAAADQRFKALEVLTKRFPDVAWDVCLEQVKPGPRTGCYSYRPRWRSDAAGAGHVVTRREFGDFTRRILDLLINWPSHDERTLGDLLESLQGMPDDDQRKVWNLIDGWSRKASETAKANLRERIRRFAFTRRARRNLQDNMRGRARKAYDRLRPNDLVIRHRWLFAEQWLQESADEIEDEDVDFRKREERVDKLRRTAMAEIWAARGFDGICRLLASSNAAGAVGHYAATCIIEAQPRVDFIQRCLALEDDLRSKGEWCLQGFLWAVDDAVREELIRAAFEALSADDRVRLFVCAPFQASTWRLLHTYDDSSIVAKYWEDVSPFPRRHSPAELTEMVDRLLEAQRPRAAFQAVHMDFKNIETSRLKRLLRDVATVANEPEGHYTLDRHHISRALDSLDGRTGVTRDEMAQLEFLFIGALDHSEHGVPNLESQIAESPALFVQAVALVYRRSVEGEDPVEWWIDDPQQRAAVASAAYRLLDAISKIPGTRESGVIDTARLHAWLAEARQLCRECGRADIGDQQLGQLLAKAPADETGIWPCEPVCEAMEGIASPEMGRGFEIGVHNSRGVHWRGEGGAQERELAAKYRTWAERLHFDYPYVGSVLEGIAESYEHEAAWRDSEANVTKRLRH